MYLFVVATVRKYYILSSTVALSFSHIVQSPTLNARSIHSLIIPVPTAAFVYSKIFIKESPPSLRLLSLYLSLLLNQLGRDHFCFFRNFFQISSHSWMCCSSVMFSRKSDIRRHVFLLALKIAADSACSRLSATLNRRLFSSGRSSCSPKVFLRFCILSRC